MRLFRRRHYLIDKKLQLKYAVLTVALLVLYTLLLLAAVFLPPAGIFFSPDLPLSLRAEAANTFILLNNYIWPGIGIIILLFGAFSILVTHKVAGPFYVATRTMRSVTDGDLKARVMLRKGDDVTELADVMNQMVEKIESTFIDLDRRAGELSAHIREASQGQSSPGLSKMAAGIEEMKKILDGYKFGVKPRD